MIDFEKFKKYSRPGPRYTSYPTAVEFSEEFSYNQYLERLHSQKRETPLSLYFHLPFCRSACYFCGCNVVFTSKEEKKERYIDYLKRELRLLTREIESSRSVIQLHFGGGTPTFFSPGQLEEIISAIKESFPNWSGDAEVSCEIDPRFLTRDHMEVLARGGFNRVSFGVQDFDPRVQEAVHRIQSLEETARAVELAREYGMESVNIDLIYGLPFQTLESFQRTLELTLGLDPDRLAVFNYAHVPWLKKTMRKIDETTLPSPDLKLAILKYTIDFLTSHGYKMIGMDHFAKPDDELFKAIEKGELHRNFQGYTTKGGADLIGIGLTSIGEGEDYYAQNYKEMGRYEEAIDNGRLPYHRGVLLTRDDKIRKMVIMELMANFKLHIPKVEEEFGIDFREYFADSLKELEEFEREGLVEITPETIRVSETGTLLIRNIVMPFDAYMKRHGEGKKVFSKTV
ncbi:MAG: oxygen-independent coproporphyrinogen III oxidase [Epsilonproteobacteria bacterium]|nr:oxygen-independent coproporphyrinogen III oxidase [Campylobacterota bacterium]NPA56644.1 oxygen-independent coproporphyrinogen III oxidase [Campylobacterota bacterium]